MAAAVSASKSEEVVEVVQIQPKKKKRAKKKKTYYFDQGTEDAIILYNKSVDPYDRNKIYNEVVAFLVMNIHKFKEGKGKAFSYFSIVAKNYLILNNNKNYKMGKIHDKIDVIDYKRNIVGEESAKMRSEVNALFTDELIRFWEHNLTAIFSRDKDIRVADSVLHIFRIKENIENFNKKALYILIREFDRKGVVDLSYTGSIIREES